MGIKKICKPWDDVFDPSLDEHLAPELDDLLSSKREVYAKPYEFFRRTYLTGSILESLENIVSVLRGKGGNNTFTIYSLFGGGKTHTLFSIYHALKNPQILVYDGILREYDEIKKNKVKQIAKDIEKIGNVRIAIIYGKDYRYCARPTDPIKVDGYKIHTVWGYLAHILGRYDDIRGDDEKITVPGISTLRKVLSDKPNVILVDEIVDYAYGLKQSKTEEEKEYVGLIPQFLDRLASAIIGTKTALIVTLPIELKGKNIENTESWYEMEFVRKYWTALHRTAAKDLPALKIGAEGIEEIVEVIKKRNFEAINMEDAEIAIKDFERVYKGNSEEVFGYYESTINSLKITYPFHPDSIEILREVIERAELQKTRDMLKLTRRMIRLIWEKDDDPYAIMPWHLDITLDVFNAELFKGRFTGYSFVARSDILQNAERFDNPELARKIATVIFLRTYTYDSPTPTPHFPAAPEVARMVYEQEVFMKNKWLPTAIVDTLEQMRTKAYMHYLQVKDEKYWFWRIASVREQVESEARKMIDEAREKIENKIQDMVEKLVRGKVGTRKRGKKEIALKVLDEKLTHITRIKDVEVRDDTSFKTIFLVNQNITGEDCGKLMFRYRDSEKTYKNTIICVFPSSSDDYKKCMYYAAIVLSCEKTGENLRQLYLDAGEDVIKVQESIIKDLYSTSENELIRQIFKTFKKIAYPAVGKDRTKPIANIIEASEGASNLLEQTYLALVSAQVGKIADSLSFNSLKKWIEDVLGIDIEETNSKKISEVKNWFKTNPAFPMVGDEDIEEAIKEGVRSLSIGVCNEKVWYKKVYEEENGLDRDTGNLPPVLEDNWRILPWKEAILRQVKRLLEEKKQEEKDKNVNIRYEVKYKESIYPLEKLMKQKDWEEIVREGFILKKTEKVVLPKKDFRIEITPDTVTVKQADKVRVRVRVKPLGEENIIVRLKPDIGTVVPSEGKLPIDCWWELEAPPERGIRSVELVVESEDQRKGSFLMLQVESEIISTQEIKEEHIGMSIFEATRIKDIELIKELNELSGKNVLISGDVEISRESETVKISLKNVEGDVAEYIVSQIKEVMGGKEKLDLTAYIRESIEVNDLIFHKISPYSGRAELKLKERRSGK